MKLSYFTYLLVDSKPSVEQKSKKSATACSFQRMMTIAWK